MALNITRGKQPKAQKIVVYGVEGIGKTTLASQFPDPLFIDTEGGTSHMDVARAEPPKTWAALLQAVDEVRATRPCSTLVVDTADWAERLCAAHVCQREGKASIEDFGYGKGYVKMAEEFGRLLDKLTELTDAGICVLLLAHSEVRKFEEPNEAGAYDRWELKLSKSGQKKIAPLVKEWADAVLFLNYKQIVENVAKDGQAPKLKARGGKRVIYATHHACWDAKNRWGMPDESPLAFESIRPYLPEVAPAPVAPAAPPAPQPAAPAQPAVAGPGQTVTFGQGGPTVAPTAEPAAPALPAKWSKVAQLCAADGIDPSEIAAASVMLGNFTADTPMENYPEDYLGFVASSWGAFKAHVARLREQAEPVPFDRDYKQPEGKE
ncbi:ATP-binding protein [uncultured Adlercreutzia sp.]|uniref:ATP-binding protein n=1 Tax=uncultured Adlercreutzia sp. TaxID=875803 RepID=UPI0025EA1138|nr:ATP-binding protein [uncultured Adlercreutzia sp.]